MEDEELKASGPPWWKPQPLTYVMWLLVAWCGLLGWLGLHIQITGSDAAGNGMATGLTNMVAGLALIITSVIAAAYLLVR
ncbi:hypothetical protein [Sphingomonas montana]|uniref:hypothetical protein n=1 Tax=Sphingomonas montana TaxID=1843236 RepID=UPI00096D8CE2|nr:hypothetical protein [Sphingomonas montana]